jgi:hypothetical protein
MKMKFAGRIGWVAIAASMVGMPALATQSNFDSGFEGWTQTSGVSWLNTGGNGGGYLRFADAGPANGGQVIAPAAFLGDWLSDYGTKGLFSVDYEVISAGTFEPFTMAVYITGAGGKIGKGFAPWANFGTPFGWTTFTVSLAPADWVVLSGTFSGALSNVTELAIVMSSASSADEVTGIDNVWVRGTQVPEPGTLAMIGLGLAGIWLTRRRTWRGASAHASVLFAGLVLASLLSGTASAAALIEAPLPTNSYVTRNGYQWAWIFAVAPDGSYFGFTPDMSYQESLGWRLPTRSELDLWAPAPTDFLFAAANVPLGGADPVSNAWFAYPTALLSGPGACASGYFASRDEDNHCDWGNAPGVVEYWDGTSFVDLSLPWWNSSAWFVCLGGRRQPLLGGDARRPTCARARHTRAAWPRSCRSRPEPTTQSVLSVRCCDSSERPVHAPGFLLWSETKTASGRYLRLTVRFRTDVATTPSGPPQI